MTVILVVSSMIAIVVSFLCSLAEAILLSLNPLAINRLQTEHARSAESWRRLKRNVAQPIAAILILNTVAHTGGATVAGGAFIEMFGMNRMWIFSVLFTLVILLGTEILPKIIGVSFFRQLAPHVGPALALVTTAMRPFVRLSDTMFRRLAPKYDAEQITTADLITLASLARSGKVIGLEQENIIVNAIRLSHTSIERAMIPGNKVRFIRQDAPFESIVALAQATGHSRYPVSRSDDVKDIFAYVRMKKAIPVSSNNAVDIVADAKNISQIRKDDSLMTGLHVMLASREHLLAVLDTHGKCVGIITLEDIASELLGADIEDFK